MPIPERLRPQSPTAEELAFFTDVCRRIENRDYADEEELTELLNHWNTRAGREYTAAEFRTYYGAMEIDEFVEGMLMGMPPFVADVTYAELRAVLEEVCSASLPQPEDVHFLGLLEANFPEANISDLIYWPNHWFENEALRQIELTDDQILAYAMAKSGRRLADAPENVPLPYPIPT